MADMEHVEGDLIVDTDREFHGTVTGDVTVTAGTRFALFGTVKGNVLVKSGAIAIIHGTVERMVQNEGALVEIHGSAGGVIDQDPEQPTILGDDGTG
ncbi:hypothetical protein PY365_04445 [Roseiarcaceae bacterium H3SJ34-1]|uniref:hypothetical protein n=1 Tax=Terripilifer ovatus TaxID=3032367 RepID=UPI003AB929B8|nr:hypothetical protein [Roseiarcaceae bacterium H3SJ34-1]